MEGNGHSESASQKETVLRIGEVSRLTSTKPFVLRYWETEFPMLRPAKSPKGHRLYCREDIETVFAIKRLLYDEGFTIAGARRHLHEQPQGTNGTSNVPAPPARSPGQGVGSAVSPPLASLNHKVLLDLRDSLRSLLTVLKSQ